MSFESMFVLGPKLNINCCLLEKEGKLNNFFLDYINDKTLKPQDIIIQKGNSNWL